MSFMAVSGHLGSIADIGTANDYAYPSSKAALNAAMKGLSVKLARRGTGVLILRPGWVRTRMSGGQAPLTWKERDCDAPIDRSVPPESVGTIPSL
jgi:NAD(P)-dependent dehydrogenase (short-subunit alcohol dehydrogenase family)